MPRCFALAALIASLAAGCLDPGPDLNTRDDEVIVRDRRNPSTGGSEHRLDTTPVFELPVTLTASRRVVFETRNRSAGSDPVLHLLAPVAGNGGVTEVARDDDSAGDYNARITYTPTTTGTYLLVMRATWKGKSGTAELLQNGQPMWTPLPFGGGFQRLENLRVNEELTTVPLPHAATANTMYLLDDSGRMLERYQSGGNQSASRRVTTARAAAIAMVGVGWLDRPSEIRLVRNDWRLHDRDGDYLGDELEAALGTCSSPSDLVGNFECSRTTDTRDTDGDGLTDMVELFGKVDSQPYQLLPRWGADPRHKDMFIEVDFLAASSSESDTKMMPALARSFAETYGDRETDPLFRLANAQTLVNPDLESGIRLHLDTGINPSATAPASDWAIYGDWGGHDVVPAVCSSGTCARAPIATAFAQHMASQRRGLFHYFGSYAGSGGSSPPHQVYASVPLDDQSGPHEFGHSLGLGHNGAYDGEDLDVNCKPNYPSLMNYAYTYAGWRRFSDGYGRPPINNVALSERAAVPAPTSLHGSRYLDHLHDVFGYNVDRTSGHVDWNRDGVFEAGTVSAYANDSGDGCEYPKYNEVQVTSRSAHAPALARVGDVTYMVSIDQNDSLALEYVFGSLACPVPQVSGCGQAPQRVWFSQPWNHDLTAIDAHRIIENNQPRLLIVYRTAVGQLWEVTYAAGLFTQPQPIDTLAPSDGELSLAGDDDTVYLAYRATAGRPMLKVRSAGTWGDDEWVRGTNGALLPLMGAASPALLEAGPSGSRTLYAVFPDADTLRLYTFDRTTRRWAESPWAMATSRLEGKAAMAWTPMPAGGALPGRLYMMWIEQASNGATVVNQQQLVAERDPTTGAPTLKLAVKGANHNSWFYGYGVSLLFEEGVDTNLRLLVARKHHNDDGTTYPMNVVLRPKADGIIDFVQRDWNEWAVLRVGLCRTLVNSTSSSLRCPAWIW